MSGVDRSLVRPGWRMVAIAAVVGLATSGCHKQEAVNASSGSAPQPPASQGAGSGSGEMPARPTVTAQPGGGAGNADSVVELKVKNALMISHEPLNWKGIQVHFDGSTVHLSGSVPNAHQKAVAERDAKGAVGGKYPVMNMLQTGGGR